MKKCPQCKTIKLRVEFNKNASTYDGLQGICRECQKLHYYANRERTNEQKRDRTMRNKYGITAVQYDQMHREQEGLCWICNLPSPSGRRLDLDHCHATGKVGKLLCSNCNNLLARAKDRVDLLEKAIDYLKEMR